MTNFEDVIERDGRLVYTNVGDSMCPLIRHAVCIAFCVNELLSIVENTSLMGIPYPPALKNAIEVLQKQTGRKDDKDD